MPKVKQYKPKAPPLDLAYGAVLVRMRQMDITMQELAEKTNHHYDSVRNVLNKPPIQWSYQMREDILGALGLKCRLVIEDAEE